MASQSQGQTQDSTIEDPRFAELLKPIKDLTQNWEVPLTEILSGYMDDLQQVTITFDGGKTSVNFAQAALLLQGTASVYSKKVDFLWQMVLKTTELLRNKKDDESSPGGEEGAAEDGRKGRKKHVDMTREFELLVTEIGKNIDLKLDEESITERKNALNFIYVTPRQLIEKEGSEQKAVKVNLYMGVVNNKWDLLAAKEDFRINGQYVVQTGYLGEELNVDNQYLNLVNEETVGDNTNNVQADSMREGGDEALAGDGPPDDDLPPADMMDDDDHGAVDNDVSVMSERAAGQQNVSTADRDMISSPPLVTKPPDDPPGTPEPTFDPWEPLDPHLVMETPKPIKVKKTTRLPPSLKSKKEPNSRPITPISEYLSKEMAIDLHKPGLFPYIPSSLSDLAYEEYERRKERERQERKARLSKRTQTQRNLFPNIPEDDNDDNDGDRYGAEDNYDDLGGNDDEADNNESNDLIDDLQLPNPHIGGDLGALVVGDIEPQAGDGDDNQTMSYEEMVARKVDEFVAQSREYMRSSELAMKVANWHEMIGPRLEQVEKRNAFDIHAYGSRILNNFSVDRNDVSFNSVVRGQKPEEKSRYFLSMLMLANTENVEISTANDTDPFLGMDNVTIKLLSTSRHHQQLEGFQPMSQGGDVTNLENHDILADVSKRGEKRNSTFRSPGSPVHKKATKKKKV